MRAKIFRAIQMSLENGDLYLRKPLEMEYKALDKLRISYLSMYNYIQKELFNKKITWEEAISICSDVGAGFSDAMI